jgi:hypothetical protein
MPYKIAVSVAFSLISLLGIARMQFAKHYPPVDTKVQVCSQLELDILRNRPKIPPESVARSEKLQEILFCEGKGGSDGKSK